MRSVRSSATRPSITPVVVRGDPVAGERVAGPVHERRGRALDHLAPDQRADGDDRGLGAARGLDRIPLVARIGPIETIGFDGPITIARAVGDRGEHLGRRGRASRAPRKSTSSTGPLPRSRRPDHELLKRPPASVRHDPRADRLVADIGSTRARTPSASTIAACATVSRSPRSRAARALDPDREVAVTEVEPDVDAELAQPVHDVERVAVEAPAALVDPVGEPERHEVRVGRDVRAVDLDVVAGVRDHDELVRLDDVEHPAGELRARRCRRRGRRPAPLKPGPGR